MLPLCSRCAPPRNEPHPSSHGKEEGSRPQGLAPAQSVKYPSSGPLLYLLSFLLEWILLFPGRRERRWLIRFCPRGYDLFPTFLPSMHQAPEILIFHSLWSLHPRWGILSQNLRPTWTCCHLSASWTPPSCANGWTFKRLWRDPINTRKSCASSSPTLSSQLSMTERLAKWGPPICTVKSLVSPVADSSALALSLPGCWRFCFFVGAEGWGPSSWWCESTDLTSYAFSLRMSSTVKSCYITYSWRPWEVLVMSGICFMKYKI